MTDSLSAWLVPAMVRVMLLLICRGDIWEDPVVDAREMAGPGARDVGGIISRID